MQSFKLALSQYRPITGNLLANAEKQIQIAQHAKKQHADLVIFPELALIGYTADDLLLRPSLVQQLQAATAQFATVIDLPMLVGLVHIDEQGQRFNSAALIKNGQVLGIYHKQNLVNYSMFAQSRYFKEGHQHLIFDHIGHKFAVLIGEDILVESYTKQLAKLGVQSIILMNASPYEVGKPQLQQEFFSQLAKKYHLNIVHINQVGGYEELLFAGLSSVTNHQGQLVAQAKFAREQVFFVDYAVNDQDEATQGYISQPIKSIQNPIAEIYQLLVMALRDYVKQAGFAGVVLGLSGGIDSALTLTLAVDALGADKVQALMMPYHYTAQMSIEDATAQAKRLGVHFGIAEIHPIVNGFKQTLQPFFAQDGSDHTEENLQARARGSLLMALSNKFGYLVLSTGNKSESAVGYCTLYGDMAGGFSPIKDVYKTIVFELAKYRNSLEETPIIPERVISRPPSAELRPNQTDQDNLPPYDILDAILYAYIEEDQDYAAICQHGFDAETVKKVIQLVDRNEHKRSQSAIGPRISARAFGRGRRYPINHGWNVGV